MAGGVAVVEGVGEVAVLDGEGEPVNGGVWVVAGGLAEAVGAEDGEGEPERRRLGGCRWFGRGCGC